MHKKMKFSIKDLVTFTKEFLNGNNGKELEISK